MTREEAIKTIQMAKSEVEWSYPMDYQVAFDMAIKALEQEPCEDAISREWLKTAIHNFYYGLTHTPTEEDIQAYIDAAPSVSTEKTDAYKQGWHDAITTALKETHSVLTEEGHFRVVQEETLIGVGMAYEQVSTEKTGRWITVDKGLIVTSYKCSECSRIVRDDTGYDVAKDYPYCHCGAKMGVEE